MASTKRTALLAGILLALLAALALFSLTVGVRDISLAGVLHALQAGSSRILLTSWSGRCACRACWQRLSAV